MPTVPITDVVNAQVNTPSLPPGTVQANQHLQANANEFATANTVNPTGVQAAQTTATAPVAQAANAGNAATATGPNTMTANTYTADVIGNNAAQATAAQGTVNPASTVQGQYERLMDFQPGQVPAWAKGAAREAEARMLARGVSNSTMAGEAVTSALAQAALPIAQQDASINFQMQMANLTNTQQTNLFNAQQRQQAMLSDQAAVNAARNFNAASQNQVDQFFQNLTSNVSENNARRLDAMQQFNANMEQQINALNAQNEKDVEIANANIKSTIDRFNAELVAAREKFNAENLTLVDQSNTSWRRQINTANTAADNAANQLNVQNLFNMSQWAQAAVWQQFRDEASWANTATENERNRAHNLVVAALQRDAQLTMLDQEQKGRLFELMGTWGLGAITGIIKNNSGS